MAQVQFAKKVLRWFDLHGRKDLPWQKRLTPYRVWVSEIMLQQTQVQTVIGYFQNFMRLFPTVKQLALAPEDVVLGAWSGLGYYARARNLHCTAKIIYHEYHGRFPKSREILETLPGIGRSTAAAICAICFDAQEAILDGNVKRVLSRYKAVPYSIESREGLAVLWPLAQFLMPAARTRDYTQAMMDLGSMVCLRSLPKCDVCPLAKTCEAYQTQRVAEFPLRVKKRKPLPVRQTYLLIFQDLDDRFLLERRKSSGIWGGLWCFPCVDSLEEVADRFGQAQGFFCKEPVYLSAFRHSFTHFHLDVQAITIRLKKNPKKLLPSQCWQSVGAPLPGGIPAPVRLLLDAHFIEEE